MRITSDVNCIFAYIDSLHKYHNKVSLFMAKNKRSGYVILAMVRATFIYTYKDYLTTACIIVEQAIRDEKTKRNRSSSDYKPSPLAIAANVDKRIEDYIKERIENANINGGAVKSFVNLMLTDYSIPILFQNDKALGEFREKYLINAEDNAAKELDRFLKFFNRFALMNIEEYENYNEWVEKIKSSNNDIFNHKKDVEDMRLVAELLCFTEKTGPILFFTCDKKCHDSIQIVAKEYKVKIGPLFLIH